MRILLQFPEGLKQYAIEEAKKLEQNGNTVFVSGSPCYGACDVALDEAKWLKADKILHFGHNKFHELDSGGIKVEYLHYPITASLDVVKQAIPELKKFKKVGIVTTVQHLHQIPDIKKILSENGIDSLTGRGGHFQEEGQILGCDPGAMKSVQEKVEAILYFGAGLFHPLGMETTLPVLQTNPYSQKITWLTKDIEKEIRLRRAALITASEAKNFGIIVSTKPGQYNLTAAELCKKKLEEKGRTATIIVSNEMLIYCLENFRHFDAFINTACPRIQDDKEMFKKPIINNTEINKLMELMQ